MVDVIDELKQKYTDKYVVVDGEQPELARFRDTYGTVKTVNMSGRALVEFADYHLNIGWYDIDPSFLKVVDQPPPKKVKEAPAKAPAAKKEAAPKAAAKPAAKPAGAGKQSTADILAALRAGGGGKAPAKPAGEPASEGGAASTKPAASPKPTGGAPAKVDRSKMSVADMLAAARAGKAAAPAEPEPVEEAAAEAPTEEAAVEAPAPAAKPASGPIDKSSMTVDQMLAYCREHDTK